MARLKNKKYPPVSWAELPKKTQLVLLVLARFSEPLTMSSLRAYMYYQLKWFNPHLSDASISSQAGYITSAFMFAQFLTGFVWGRLADSEYLGRKKVLIIGLIGSCFSILGFGFSQTFAWAMFFRIMAGLLNGNVGVIRTMVSELVKDKKYQPRAFMLMPMTGNIGQVLGPLIGGLLSDPVNAYPGLFGIDSYFGGVNGVRWMIKYPYLLPNLAAASFLFFSSMVVILGLEETHHQLRDQRDYGLEFGIFLAKRVFRFLLNSSSNAQYTRLAQGDNDDRNRLHIDNSSVELQDTPTQSPIISKPAGFLLSKAKIKMPKLPFRRIFTRNVIFANLSRGLLAMHIGTFGNLWYMFLSTPRADNSSKPYSIYFTGGLGLPASTIGVVISIIGAIGIFLQLVIYPPLSEKFGTSLTYRFSLLLFPLAYFLAPFIDLLPSSAGLPLPAAGVWVWASMLGVLGIHVLARTFAMPASTILVNNSCPHPSVLSTIHGVSQSVSSGMRMLGPVMGGWGFAIGLSSNFVAMPFWLSMGISVVACLMSLLVYEGDGHEIRLPGDDEFEEQERLRELKRNEMS